jgi:ligand-binding sensor domain-containing protein
MNHLTIIAFLFACLNTGMAQTQAGHSSTAQPSPQMNAFNLTPFTTIDRNIRSIFQDKSGTYWFGTNAAGVYRYDKKSLTRFTVKDGLADNQVQSIQQDGQGTIWFGTGAFGVSKFDGSQFTTCTTNNTLKITSGTDKDWQSKTSDLWFYAGGGVLRYSDPSLAYLPLDPSALHSTPQPNAPFTLSRYGVYSILKDKKGNLWMGTQAQGVCRYDGTSLTWFREKGLAGPAVLALFEDSKGNLWFGNNGSGLFRYDGTTLINFTVEKGLGNADFNIAGKSASGTLARVYSINEDLKGNIWIGTVDSGVWKYDGTSLTNYTTKDGLTSNAVNTIYRDNSGELWFGTDSNGICTFDGTSFTEFTPN